MADTDSNAHTPLSQDKGLLGIAIFLLSLICNAISRKYGIELNPTEIATLGATIISWIAAGKWKAGTVLAAETHVAGAKAAAETLALAQAKTAASSGAAAVDALASIGLKAVPSPEVVPVVPAP